MRKVIGIITLLLCFVFGSVVQAHSGRTDSSGGHNCSESSQAKGLCTGYHYHNGGGSSSSGSSSSGTSTSSSSSYQSGDKDCPDFSSYDEVVAYWNAKGYTKDNDPERLDGWGNVVDDGIPCEAPSGYDKTKINGSAEQVAQIAAQKAAIEAAQAAERDKAQGDKEGYSAGYQAGYIAATKNINANGSDAYKQGYQAGYERGYAEGTTKLASDKESAVVVGNEQGMKQDNLDIPAPYKGNAILETAFTEAFNKAVVERDKLKVKEFTELGYNDGKNYIENNNPKDVKELYTKAYQEGFNKGVKELQETYVQQGYEAALASAVYKEPELPNPKFIEWYKEGFDKGLTEGKKIKEAGRKLALEGKVYKVPAKYVKGEVFFKAGYDEGKTEYEKNLEQGEETLKGIGLFGLLCWFGRRFYVARKMIK